jgi:hypothetical protein
MTYATEASFIIQDEFMARARAKAATLADDELRELLRGIIDEERKYFTDAGGLRRRNRLRCLCQDIEGFSGRS